MKIMRGTTEVNVMEREKINKEITPTRKSLFIPQIPLDMHYT